ncbi:hypothetical protein HCN51_32635 [Nonomuraea sp. FMUSA5-5]|uniref:Uncharacterized protein n=1 Tax=Nonomuraea composti TaxID=2720023 RepID=A0ABX1BEE6_9ACTN|nr:hypothetical protein [Nonomuraea sp. FMUSA5-5]NJP94129.1 hypothetical protein [Nonomuraea sp. FMUSA5-5]
MSGHAVLDELRQAIDEVFHGRERVVMRDVYAQASRHVNLSADLLTHLNELPEGPYDRRELTEAINEVITRRGEQDTLGLLEVPQQAGAAPLEYLNPTPTVPDEDEGPDLMR